MAKKKKKKQRHIWPGVLNGEAHGWGEEDDILVRASDRHQHPLLHQSVHQLQQRRDSIMAWSVVLSVYGADKIGEVKSFSSLHFTISCRLDFKHLLFHLDWQKILVKNRKNFQRIKLS